MKDVTANQLKEGNTIKYRNEILSITHIDVVIKGTINVLMSTGIEYYFAENEKVEMV